jgi:hypothetical protein
MMFCPHFSFFFQKNDGDFNLKTAARASKTLASPATSLLMTHEKVSKTAHHGRAFPGGIVGEINKTKYLERPME